MTPTCPIRGIFFLPWQQTVFQRRSSKFKASKQWEPSRDQYALDCNIWMWISKSQTAWGMLFFLFIQFTHAASSTILDCNWAGTNPPLLAQACQKHTAKCVYNDSGGGWASAETCADSAGLVPGCTPSESKRQPSFAGTGGGGGKVVQSGGKCCCGARVEGWGWVPAWQQPSLFITWVLRYLVWLVCATAKASR